MTKNPCPGAPKTAIREQQIGHVRLFSKMRDLHEQAHMNEQNTLGCAGVRSKRLFNQMADNCTPPPLYRAGQGKSAHHATLKPEIPSISSKCTILHTLHLISKSSVLRLPEIIAL